MKHNKELSITIGGSRKETNWKPQRIMWQEFVERLRTPVESEETQEEYKRLTKAQQDDLKDVGGFVGGLLNGSRRKSGSVKSRCLITLDMDNIPAGSTEDVLKRVNGLGCAFVVYSTRKHEGAAPRLRVIFPTDRELVPDEYEPIARRIASLIHSSVKGLCTGQAAAEGQNMFFNVVISLFFPRMVCFRCTKIGGT